MKKLIFVATLLALSAVQVQAKPYLDIHEIHTPKGLTAYFVRDVNIPVLALQFSVPVRDDTKGVGNLLSTLLDEGAGKRDAEAFQNDMDSHGIALGFTVDRDQFGGRLKTTMRDIALATELLHDALNAPHLDDDAVSRMKQAIASNMRFQAMNPDYLAGRKLNETLFAGDAYAAPVDGTPETLAAITKTDLQDYRAARLTCGRHFRIAVTGDATEAQVSQMLDMVFGDLATCNEEKRPFVALVPAHAGETIRVDWQGAQNTVIMAQPGLNRGDKDWWAARILDFALGGGEFSSRLMNEVRVKRGLTYGVSSSLAPYDRSPLWLVQSNIDIGKTDDAIALIKQTWGNVAAHGLTDAEIRAAKDYLIGSLPLALTSTDRIAGILLQLQEDNLPINTLDTRDAEINAVTPADIVRVAQVRLHDAALTTIIVGPAPVKPPQPEKK